MLVQRELVLVLMVMLVVVLVVTVEVIIAVVVSVRGGLALVQQRNAVARRVSPIHGLEGGGGGERRRRGIRSVVARHRWTWRGALFIQADADAAGGFSSGRDGTRRGAGAASQCGDA